MTRSTKILGGLLVAGVLATGAALEYTSDSRKLGSFQSEVEDLGFELAPGEDENPKWDYDKYRTAQMQTLVAVGCWTVQLELPKGGKLKLGEVHFAPSILNIEGETSVSDFNGALTPENVLKYLQERQYPCAS